MCVVTYVARACVHVCLLVFFLNIYLVTSEKGVTKKKSDTDWREMAEIIYDKRLHVMPWVQSSDRAHAEGG